MEFLGDGAELRLASRAVNTESDERDEEIGYERWRSCDGAVLAFADKAGKVVARSSDDVVDPLPCDRWAHFSKLGPMRVAELVRDLMLDLRGKLDTPRYKEGREYDGIEMLIFDWRLTGSYYPYYRSNSFTLFEHNGADAVMVKHVDMMRSVDSFDAIWTLDTSSHQYHFGKTCARVLVDFPPEGIPGVCMVDWLIDGRRAYRETRLDLRLFGT